MEENITIDFEKLREDLIDYYGTAMFNGFPAAMMELEEVKRANPEKLVNIALEKNINLENYIIKENNVKKYYR